MDLIETKTFGKLVVEKSVMTEGHLAKSMILISEGMTILMFEKFQADQDSIICELAQQIEIAETKMQQAPYRVHGDVGRM